MRYTRQVTKYDCAAVGIVNASKWAGHKVSYKDTKDYFDYLFDLSENGVSIKSLSHFLFTHKHLPFKVVGYEEGVKFKHLPKDDNYACILLTHNGSMFHVSLLIKLTNTYATLVNWDTKQTIRKLKTSALKKHLNNFAIAYIIKKL